MRHSLLYACTALSLGLGTALAQETAAQEGADQAKTIIAHGISVFGEPALPADYKHFPYVNPDAPKGGELSTWGQGGFDSFNPFTAKGRATAIGVVMLERLMESPADEEGSAYCLLCETIEYPENRDWVIFHLRPEAKFSDGTPLTARDVKFSFELLRDHGMSSYRTAIIRMISEVEVIDDHTVKFIFTPDYPRRNVIQQAGYQLILSQADFEKNKRDIGESSTTPFLGSGPYVFDKADMGRSITVKRNPDYWGKDLPINVGRHNFDSIRYEFFADYDAAFEAFKAGVYTFRDEASSIHWATQYDFPAVKSGAVKREEIRNGNIARGQAWVFNLRREKFQDIRVREAIALMFNFEWSNESLFYMLNARVNSFWENSDLGAKGQPTEAELKLLEPLVKDLPEGILTDEAVVQPVSSSKSQIDRRNRLRASALLDEAGWVVGADGKRRNAKGETLRVEFLNDNQSFDRIINPYVKNLESIGVDAVNARVDDAEMTNRTRSHDFDIISDSLGQGFYIGGGTEQIFGSENVGDVFNSMGLANPAVDALIKKGIEATTAEENANIIRATDRALRALRFWVPQWYRTNYQVAYYDMYGHPEAMPPYDLGLLDFWWYDADKAENLKKMGALR